MADQTDDARSMELRRPRYRDCDLTTVPNWRNTLTVSSLSGRCIMQSYIRRENLKRYRNLLMVTSDEAVRSQLFKLIAEEERKKFLQQISEQQSTDEITSGAAN
jgi:hypothetical protein